MAAIETIITAPPTLPSRFVSSEYDRFMFFDFFVRESGNFFEKIQNSVGRNSDLSLYDPNSLQLLGEFNLTENWSTKLKILNDELMKNGNPFGLVVLPDDQRWVMIQDLPVNLGVLAFRHSDAEVVDAFEALRGDWLVSIDDFVRAAHDPTSDLNDILDEDFIKQISSNYG